MKKKGFTQHHFSTKSGERGLPSTIFRKNGAGFTIVELLIVVAVMALLTAALSPLFRTSYQAWRLGDRRAEVIQNARIGMDKMSWELKQIKMVSDVSSPTNPQGYITFLDYEENLKEFRYEVGYLAYVSGTVATLAGPIESLYFSCYEADGGTLTTSPANISIIVAQMVTSDEEGEVDSLTTTDRIYLRRGKGWVQVNWSGGTTTPTLEVVTTTTTKYYQATNVDHTTLPGQVTLTSSIADYVVISEVQTRGGVAADEFVELYNPTDSSINLQTYPIYLHIRNSAGTDGNKTITWTNSTIPAYGYFLIASAQSYDGTVAADATYTTASGNTLVADGCVYISNTSTNDTSQAIDLLGWGTQPSPGYEDTAFNSGSSYQPAAHASIERKSGETHSETQGNGYDTDDNSADWRTRSAADPQNSSSATEDPPGGSGTLESSVYDTGASGTEYDIMDWDASTPINTDVKFQIRTGISISDLSSKSFVGPDGMTDTYYTTSGTDIWSGHDEDQYIQYKAVLTTTDPLISPILYEVVIELE